LRKNLESACQSVTRADPKDGGVAVHVNDANIEEFTERRWLTGTPHPRIIRTESFHPPLWPR
jgi:hypothetical protein